MPKTIGRSAGGDADAIVFDRDGQLVPFLLRASTRIVPSRIGVLGRVGEQVRQHLRETQRIAVHLQVVRHLEDELVLALVDERARGLHRGADDGLQIGRAACAAARCRA